MFKLNIILGFIIFFAFRTGIRANEIGKPVIINYSSKVYQAHGQNWQIIKGPKGTIYSANSDGILSYNGVSWKLIRLPAFVIVRSLDVDENVIYVGAQDQMGFIKPDSFGNMKYMSLVDLLPDSIENFGDVWQVRVADDYVYFLTRHLFIKYDKVNNQFVRIIKAKTFFHTFHIIDDTIYIQQPGVGFMYFSDDKFNLLLGCGNLKDSRVYSVLKRNDGAFLIGTRKSGIQLYKNKKCTPFKTQIDEWILKNKLFYIAFLRDSSLAISTLENGIAIIDRKGKLLLQLDKKSGLQDNTVWHIYPDNENNIWLSLNKGISKVNWPSPYSFYSEDNGLIGNVQSIVRFKDEIYAATSYGVYVLRQEGLKNVFQKVAGIETQCWNIKVINNRLFVAANDGIWEILPLQQVRRRTVYNAWTITQSGKNENLLFVGLQDGIVVLKIQPNGTVTDFGRLPDLSIDARTLASDSTGALYVGTTRTGLYRLIFENDQYDKFKIEHFTDQNGLPAMNNNLVFPMGKEIAISTVGGIYKYQANPKKLSAFISYDSLDIHESAFYMMDYDLNRNIWINNGQVLAVFEWDKNKMEFIWKKYLDFPEMNIYTIYSEKNVVWFGGPEGIVRMDDDLQFQPGDALTTFISSISFKKDSISIGPFFNEAGFNPRVSYENNSLRVSYHSDNFKNTKSIKYQFKLDGFENDWSEWTDEPQKDYTNLFEGDYTFNVRSQNIYGEVGSPSQFFFSIRAPWYRTYWAYFTYIIIFGFILNQAIRYRYIRKKHLALIEMQKIQNMKKETEENLRLQMAADFHDELGNKITRISLFSGRIQKFGNKLPQEVLSYVSKISDNAQTLYWETRDFIWQLDPEKDTLFDSIVRLKNFADQMFDGSGINFIIENKLNNTPGIKLDMEWRRNIIRIMKEAMHNALKHSGCKNISLTLSEENNKVLFSLTDDGSGYKDNTEVDGTGFKNMKNRANKIGADLQIFSDKKGTSIKLSISTPLGS